jgi:MEMO1 family protein
MQDSRPSPAVRNAAVAGLFYSADPEMLGKQLDSLLLEAHAVIRWPKILIVPHAGYIYSGPIAAQAYASLGAAARSLTRVVLLGPSHREWFRGLAMPEARAFATPLGVVQIDIAAARQLRGLPATFVSDVPHALEHSLEVQLPFLQRLAPEAQIVPVLACETDPAVLAEAIDALWGGSETLIIASSDLSHYHSYRMAQALDTAAAGAILERREDLTGEQACGCMVVNGIARVARARGLHPELLDLRNSGDTAGDRDRVVGYGAFAYYDA